MTTRDRLAEALWHQPRCLALLPPVGTTIATTGPCTCWVERQALAGLLLPVVDAIAAERAKAELEAAAEALSDERRFSVAAERLRARAAGLIDKDGQR